MTLRRCLAALRSAAHISWAYLLAAFGVRRAGPPLFAAIAMHNARPDPPGMCAVGMCAVG